MAGPRSRRTQSGCAATGSLAKDISKKQMRFDTGHQYAEWLAVIATIFLLLSLCGAIAAAQQPYLFRSEVALVHLDVEVTELNGRVITG